MATVFYLSVLLVDSKDRIIDVFGGEFKKPSGELQNDSVRIAVCNDQRGKNNPNWSGLYYKRHHSLDKATARAKNMLKIHLKHKNKTTSLKAINNPGTYLPRYSVKPKEVTRDIAEPIKCMLWGKAAGRCEFTGCNKELWKSHVTQEPVNIAQKAHIYSFSEEGPRGNKGIAPKELNGFNNLILVCYDCHQKIDKEPDGGRYTVELLQEMKKTHEERTVRICGIDPSLKSHIVIYGANVGKQNPIINYTKAATAMFPDRYPAEDREISLGVIDSSLRDSDPSFFDQERQNLERHFDQRIKRYQQPGNIEHLSIFALAPQPLLINLGILLTDLSDVDVFQLHKEPKIGWSWNGSPTSIEFIVKRPPSLVHKPALVLGLSATVTPDRITSILGSDTSIWEITLEKPDNDFMKTRKQLSIFRHTIRTLFDEIKATHGHKQRLHIFPVAPISTCIEFGRVRQNKADMPWRVYDEIRGKGFVEAFDID